MCPFGGTTPEEDEKIERCILGIKGINPKTKKPYTKAEKIAICKSQILKKSEDEIMNAEEIEMAVWTRKFINSLPNSSFAVVEPDFLSGKTEDKNARHLPYKDASGKVDIPHLRNARARMNQIKPVTNSISTEALRAKAKRVLDAAAKKHLKQPEMGDDELIHLSMDMPSKIELIEDDEESPTYKIKFELIDVGEYNKFDFSLENLKFMVKEFADDDIGLVSHGLDHSVKTLEQLGKVYDLRFDDSGGKQRVYAFSELFKETEAQKQAHILFKQGLLNFVSGGWKPKKFMWNDEKNNITVIEPKLKEVSSTPVPAKRDAKAQEILNSLTQAPNMEELEMTEENQDEKPSLEGEDVVVEQSAELSTLKTETKAELEAIKKEREAFQKERAEMKAKADQEEIASLMERAKELGLSEDLFKDGDTYKSPEAIRLALAAAKELKVELLSEQEPKVVLNGEGITLENGSPEMADHLLKTHMPWLLAGI